MRIPSPSITARNRGLWRSWLRKNHRTSSEVWLIYYKVAARTKHPSVGYSESVEEALCFGWIDGKVLRIDEQRCVRRFTPRKKNSRWSLVNKRRAEKLLKLNQLAAAGKRAIEEAKKNGSWRNAYGAPRLSSQKLKIPMDLKKALQSKSKAWKNFMAFSPSYRSQYLVWIQFAKREETRHKRIAKVVQLAQSNKKPSW